jgi:predicted DCC family thiol-disulfide oxidoreductase YuxK
VRRLTRLLDARAPARPVALARIGVSAAILLEGWASAGTLHRLAEPGVLAVPYLDGAPAVTSSLVWVLIGAWAASGLAFLVGLRTRIAGAVLVATLAAVLLLDQQLYSNHLYLMALVAGLLALADCGAALSVDARRIVRDQVPGWPVWLLRVQVSIVYGFAALAKLNAAFLSGSVIASSLRREGPLAVPADWRALEPMLVLSVLAICLEALVAIGLWLDRWRPAALVGGLALHVGITAWLSPTFQLLVFSLVMLPLYLVFLEATPAGRVVVWDDGCGFCAGWVRWFRRLDWLGVLRFVPISGLAASGLPVSPDEAVRAVQLVTGSRVHAGFAAVTRVAEALPVSFLWAPLLRLPPIAAVGEVLYRRVAIRRTCALPASTARAASR